MEARLLPDPPLPPHASALCVPPPMAPEYLISDHNGDVPPSSTSVHVASGGTSPPTKSCTGPVPTLSARVFGVSVPLGRAPPTTATATKNDVEIMTHSNRPHFSRQRKKRRLSLCGGVRSTAHDEGFPAREYRYSGERTEVEQSVENSPGYPQNPRKILRASLSSIPTRRPSHDSSTCLSPPRRACGIFHSADRPPSLPRDANDFQIPESGSDNGSTSSAMSSPRAPAPLHPVPHHSAPGAAHVSPEEISQLALPPGFLPHDVTPPQTLSSDGASGASHAHFGDNATLISPPHSRQTSSSSSSSSEPLMPPFAAEDFILSLSRLSELRLQRDPQTTMGRPQESDFLMFDRFTRESGLDRGMIARRFGMPMSIDDALATSPPKSRKRRNSGSPMPSLERVNERDAGDEDIFIADARSVRKRQKVSDRSGEDDRPKTKLEAILDRRFIAVVVRPSSPTATADGNSSDAAAATPVKLSHRTEYRVKWSCGAHNTWEAWVREETLTDDHARKLLKEFLAGGGSVANSGDERPQSSSPATTFSFPPRGHISDNSSPQSPRSATSATAMPSPGGPTHPTAPKAKRRRRRKMGGSGAPAKAQRSRPRAASGSSSDRSMSSPTISPATTPRRAPDILSPPHSPATMSDAPPSLSIPLKSSLLDAEDTANDSSSSSPSSCSSSASATSASSSSSSSASGDDKSFECNVCHRTFKFNRSLNRHIQSKHKGGYGSCQLCGDVTFSQKVSYEKHIAQSQKHLKKLFEIIAARDPQVTRADCLVASSSDKQTRMKYDRPRIERHLKRLSLNVEGVVSNTPDPEAEKAKALEDVRVKKMVRPPESDANKKLVAFCSICKQGFTRKATVNLHMKTVHCRDFPFQCELCEQCFATKHNLRQHLNTHNGSKPYKCAEDQCDAAFSSLANLSRHRMTHSQMAFTCTICHKQFSDRSNLKRHITQVHKVWLPSNFRAWFPVTERRRRRCRENVDDDVDVDSSGGEHDDGEDERHSHGELSEPASPPGSPSVAPPSTIGSTDVYSRGTASGSHNAAVFAVASAPHGRHSRYLNASRSPSPVKDVTRRHDSQCEVADAGSCGAFDRQKATSHADCESVAAADVAVPATASDNEADESPSPWQSRSVPVDESRSPIFRHLPRWPSVSVAGSPRGTESFVVGAKVRHHRADEYAAAAALASVAQLMGAR